jgi:hypothetical protein
MVWTLNLITLEILNEEIFYYSVLKILSYKNIQWKIFFISKIEKRLYVILNDYFVPNQ